MSPDAAATRRPAGSGISGLFGRLGSATGLRRRQKSELGNASSSAQTTWGSASASGSGSGLEMPRTSTESTVEAFPLSADSRVSSWADDVPGGSGPGPLRSSGDSTGTGTGESSHESDYGDPETRRLGAGGLDSGTRSHFPPGEYYDYSYTSDYVDGEDAYSYAEGGGDSGPPSPQLRHPTPRAGIPPHVAMEWDAAGTLPRQPPPAQHHHSPRTQRPTVSTHISARMGMSSPLRRVAYDDRAGVADVFDDSDDEESSSDDNAGAHEARPRAQSFPLDQRTHSGRGRPRPGPDDAPPPPEPADRSQSVSSPFRRTYDRHGHSDDDSDAESGDGEGSQSSGEDVLEISVRRPSMSASAPASARPTIASPRGLVVS